MIHRILHVKNSAGLVFFFLCSFLNLFRQLSTNGFALPHCFYHFFCWSEQHTLHVASEIFLWTKLVPLLFRKTGLSIQSAARQLDTVSNFTTSEDLELIDEGQIFTIRGNKGWPWQYLKINLTKYHSPLMSNSEHWGQGTGTDGFLI